MQVRLLSSPIAAGTLSTDHLRRILTETYLERLVSSSLVGTLASPSVVGTRRPVQEVTKTGPNHVFGKIQQHLLDRCQQMQLQSFP